MLECLIIITALLALFATIFWINYHLKLQKIHKALDKNLYFPRHCFEEGYRLTERSILNEIEQHYYRKTVIWKNIAKLTSLVPLSLIILKAHLWLIS